VFFRSRFTVSISWSNKGLNTNPKEQEETILEFRLKNLRGMDDAKTIAGVIKITEMKPIALFRPFNWLDRQRVHLITLWMVGRLSRHENCAQ
jgi:hypothetical protein